MMQWSQFWPPIQISLQISFISSLLVVVCGVVAARWMNRARFKGKTLVETLFMLPLVLPPTVVGFILLVMLGRNGWIGQLITRLFDTPIIFTWRAGIIAAVVVAFPLVYQTMKVGFAAVDKEAEEAARSEGASEWQMFRYITLPLTSPALLAAYILGFARCLGEFGATLMIAGNIPGRTQTVPTAIYVAVESGNMPMAWIWTGAIILISFLMLLVARRNGA